MFEELSTRVLGFSEYFIFKIFISKLKEEIQTEVLRDKSEDLEKAFDIALIVESQQAKKGYYKHKNQFKSSSYRPFISKFSNSTHLDRSCVT